MSFVDGADAKAPHHRGCGEAGDVFDLVEKMKGVGFGEALRYLKDWAERMPGVPTSRGESQKPKAASSSASKESLSQFTLDTVSTYYHKRFYGSKEAGGYPKRRGLEQRELWER